MKKISSVIAFAVLAVMLIPLAAQADTDKETGKINDSIEVIEQIMGIPESGIPQEILAEAQGIAIIPGVIKAGFFLGGRYGTGVMLIRNPEGVWSRPAFISIGGGSIGWQVGVQSIDIILVFKSRKGVENMMRGKFTLGADAGVAAGPVGRRVEAGTDVQLKAEIVSYSRTRGLFVGLSLEGASLQVDDTANEIYYGRKASEVRDIFMSKELTTPASAEKLRQVLKRYTNGKEAPVKETPAAEAPAKETPAKEAPVKEAPAMETPVKETPAKEAPATDKG